MEEIQKNFEAKTIKNQPIKEKLKGPLGEILFCVCAFLVTCFLFFTLKPHIEYLKKGAIPHAFMAISLLLCGGFIAYMGMAKRLTMRKLMCVLLIIGFILRVGYMLYTPASYRQHDTYNQSSTGHEAYAWTIFTTGKLPTTNKYQFYHPPLNAMVQAFFMKLTSGFTEAIAEIFSLGDYFTAKFAYGKPSYIDEERFVLYQTCQILSVTYSFITALFLVKIISLFNFSDKMKLFLSAFVVLYPRHIQFSGLLNNDALSYMLGIMALYCALKWQRENRQRRWIFACALAVGFGMMAKLSSATICLPIAGIFIYEFICTLRKKEGAMKFLEMVLQYGVFLAICAPIGLWFQVYANMRFGQEFGYVFDNLSKKLYTGDYSFFSRFFIAFDIKEYWGTIFCRADNYNLFNFALKSSIFGENSYSNASGVAIVAILMAQIAAILLTACIVWSVVIYYRKRKQGENVLEKINFSFSDTLFVVLLMLSQVGSEIYFYIKMPYACTMDFRYIMPLILGMALTMGLTGKILTADGKESAVAMKRITYIFVTMFIVVSTAFYCICI